MLGPADAFERPKTTRRVFGLAPVSTFPQGNCVRGLLSGSSGSPPTPFGRIDLGGEPPPDATPLARKFSMPVGQPCCRAFHLIVQLDHP